MGSLLNLIETFVPTTDINNNAAEINSVPKKKEKIDGEKQKLSNAVEEEEEKETIVSNLPDETQVETLSNKQKEASDKDSLQSL